MPPPAVPAIPAAAEVLDPPELSASAPNQPSDPAPFTIASGEKAKARDILAAMRAVKTIDHEGRPATAAERQSLARFGGFGPVALSIFPDPGTGRYKDAAWQRLGEELKELLTPEEYDSAKRTTFNAFYTSPTVITAMNEALCRLGVPGNATILEPGCGTGNFMSQGRPGLRYIGVELDRISGRIAQLLHPGQEQNPDLAAADLVKECPFLGIGVGIADGRDLFVGDASGGQILHDFLVGRVTPGRRVAFEIQYCRIGGVRAVVFEKLFRALNPGKERKDIDLLDVVRPLIIFASELPQYAQRGRSGHRRPSVCHAPLRCAARWPRH
jgi:hypothetical protein